MSFSFPLRRNENHWGGEREGASVLAGSTAATAKCGSSSSGRPWCRFSNKATITRRSTSRHPPNTQFSQSVKVWSQQKRETLSKPPSSGLRSGCQAGKLCFCNGKLQGVRKDQCGELKGTFLSGVLLCCHSALRLGSVGGSDSRLDLFV